MLLFFWLLFSTQPKRSIELTIGYASEGLTFAPGVNLIDVSLTNPNNTPPFIIPADTEEGEITIEVFPGGVNVEEILDGSIFVSPDSSAIEFSGVVTTPKQTQDLDELLGNGVFTFPGSENPQGTYFLPIETNEVLKDLINNSTQGRKTKGRTTQYDHDFGGGFAKANEIFDSLNLTDVEELNSSEFNGRVGKLDDGRTVIVRDGSSGDDPRPTLEIQKGKRLTKIRF